MDIKYKTVKNGNLQINKVPHWQINGEVVYPAYVMYNLSKLFRYMLDNDLRNINYYEVD